MKNPSSTETRKSWKAIDEKARYLRACIYRAEVTGAVSMKDTRDISKALFNVVDRARNKAERTMTKEQEANGLASFETALVALGVALD